MSGTLYLCGTPIGNLGDITLRVLEILKSVDLIAAEDTRNTLKLLNHFEIKATLTSYFEHNKAQKGVEILNALLSGKDVALVSDAGMPVISDPGEDLVRLCIENNIEIVTACGPTAFTTALVSSGLPGGRFAFEGFLSAGRRERSERLDEIKNDSRTLIFYEAPHKLMKTLPDMLLAFGDRKIAVCRELTKKFEEIYRGKISEAIAHFTETPPKGEFVLVVEGADPKAVLEKEREGMPSPQELLKLWESDTLYGKELVRAVAQELKLPKREVYDIYLEMGGSHKHGGNGK